MNFVVIITLDLVHRLFGLTLEPAKLENIKYFRLKCGVIKKIHNLKAGI